MQEKLILLIYFWAHNAEHTKTVLSRYNGTGNEADEYGDECYDYFEIF